VAVLELLKKTVRPEFINRIDEIVMFRPLNRNDIRKIVTIQVDLIRKRLSDSGIQLEVTEAAEERLAKLGFDPQYGARPLKRVLQRELLNELSRQILAGTITRDAVIQVDLKNDVEFEFQNIETAEVLH
jgi:ATP-dependent Clp protease ATP-binding subunit ClpB